VDSPSFRSAFTARAHYVIVCHGGARGQTLGKQMMGIAVRDTAGLGRLGYKRAVGR
jgi:uncharacterized RDD family membrane protein YckC